MIRCFCDAHEEDEDFEMFEWTDDEGQLCVDCPICEAEEILRDWSELKYF